mgnify:CR=1 FL=1
MRVLGIVVEFNPIHNGHQYFIEQAKEKVKPDIIIAVMSSSFSMRGDAMVIDKWERSKIALEYGIDIILELPYLATVASADYFCYNAIKTLTAFGITDLAFGAELDNLDKLNEITNILNSHSFNSIIKESIDKGLSYANSSYKALKELTNDQTIIDSYSLPNNTLAVGYLKALKDLNEEINVTIIKRIENNYFDEELNETSINSATSLRKQISLGMDITSQTKANYHFLNPNIANNNLLQLLRFTMIIRTDDELANISGVNEGIENRIRSFINETQNYDELVKIVKTRRFPPNRIKRVFLNIILNINKEYENNYHYYLRIMAMNTTGKKYVNKLPKEIKNQIITSFKNQDNYLVNVELNASKLFGLIYNQPNIFINEFKTPYVEGAIKYDNKRNQGED